MKIVYKYDLYAGYTNILVGGMWAKPVKVGMQNGAMKVWIEHTMMGNSTPINFIVVGTGQSIMPNYTYLDSIFDEDYVWHVYYSVDGMA